MHLEISVEDYFVKRVKRAGGVAIKIEPRGTTGWPDRFAFLPGRRLLIVELKRPKGGVISRKQKAIHRMLRKLGFDPVFACNHVEIDALFEP